MNRIRYLAAGLLCLTGIIHVAQLAMAPLEASVVIMVIFGVAYLIIGSFLFRNNKTAYYFGTIVPLIGLCLGTLSLLKSPTILMALLIVIDVVVAIGCLYLIKRTRSA